MQWNKVKMRMGVLFFIVCTISSNSIIPYVGDVRPYKVEFCVGCILVVLLLLS